MDYNGKETLKIFFFFFFLFFFFFFFDGWLVGGVFTTIVDQTVWKGFDTENDAFSTTAIQIVLPFGLSLFIPFLPFSFFPFNLSFLGLGKSRVLCFCFCCCIYSAPCFPWD